MPRISMLMFGALLALAAQPDALGQQFQTKAEYDAYMALYDEQDAPAKIRLGEAFIQGFPESEAAPIAYQLLVATYYSQRDWQNLVVTAKEFDRAFPDADAQTRSYIYTRAMAAAQQVQAPLDILDFGDKILELDRNNLGALLTLPPVILDNMPEFGSGRERNLARAFELANRARVRAQEAYPASIVEPQQLAQRVQVFSRIHLYLGQVHELRGDDPRAAVEYARILEYDPRNSDAYLRLGLSYQRQAAAESELLQQAIDRAADEEQTPAQGAGGNSEAIEETVVRNLDTAIDYLASAAALGGQAADLARIELERLYAMRNEDSLDGLDELVNSKRTALTAPETQ